MVSNDDNKNNGDSWWLMMIWLVVSTYPSEKYDPVSWDDYSQYMEKIKMFQTTNQIITIG